MFRPLAFALFTLCLATALSACNGGSDITTANSGTGGSGGSAGSGGGGGLSGTGGSGGSSGSSACSQTSGNWSGYVLTGAPGSFHRVAGNWTVPAVQCSGGNDSASATWTGIGGGTSTDPTLIQAGTTQECISGSPSYSAWWEAIPAPSANPNMLSSQSYDVKPGDQITVTVDGGSTIVWSITIHNASQGWTFNTAVPYGAAGATAEWIEEAPLAAGTSGAGQQSLGNFGRVVFSSLTANAANPALTTGDCVAMTDSNDSVIANPSAPGANGDSFAVCFGSGACQ